MADGLDDFFAKKDRKKSKGQKKPEEGSKKETVRERPRPRADGEEPRPGEEEEWKEYEETVKDYTGLKIQVLAGGQGGGGSEGGGAAGDDAPAGTEAGKGKGPWNKSDQQPDAPPPPPVEEAPKPRAEPPPPPKANKYVPPASRNQSAPEPTMRRVQNRHAPDIHNDDHYPELGAAASKRGGGWVTAAGQQSGRAAPAQTRRPLALGNRFNSLQDS